MDAREIAERINNRTVTEESVVEIVTELESRALQHAMQALPGIIDNLVKQSAVLQNLSTEFYAKNRDLAEHKDVVAGVIEKLEADNPGTDLSKLIEKAAPIARRRLSEMRRIGGSNSPTNLKMMDVNLGKI